MIEIETLLIQSHQDGLSYRHQVIHYLALDHSEQLVFGNGDGDSPMQRQHQWLCLVSEQYSNSWTDFTHRLRGAATGLSSHSTCTRKLDI